MHSQIKVLRAVKSSEAHNGEHLYELQPDSYDGPWELAPGTVLEVVSTLKEEQPQ